MAKFKMSVSNTLDFSARLQKEINDGLERIKMKDRYELAYKQRQKKYYLRGGTAYDTPITVQFSEKQVKLIEMLSNAQNTSKSAYLRVIIERHLRQK